LSGLANLTTFPAALSVGRDARGQMEVGVSVLPSVLGLAGVLYFFGALVLSTALVQVCLWAASEKTNVRAKWLMHATILHIPVLLGLMMYDKVAR